MWQTEEFVVIKRSGTSILNYFLQFSGEAVFLVTTLTRTNSSTPIDVFIRHTLESTAAIVIVTNLIRFGKPALHKMIVMLVVGIERWRLLAECKRFYLRLSKQYPMIASCGLGLVTSHLISDGCGHEILEGVAWPESNIGQVVQLPCPCDDLLQSGNKTSRTCGGTYSHGGQWLDVDYSQCGAVVNQVTNILCSIAMV